MRALTAKEKAKNSRLTREYGITLVDYKTILKYQKGKCAFCEKPINYLTKKGKRTADFAVDHCHTSGLVRGLLCMLCNRALAKFQDDAKRLLNASRYITAPPATAALGREHFTLPGRVGTKARAKARRLAALKIQ